MTGNEIIQAIALAHLHGVNPATARLLYNRAGSAAAVFASRKNLGALVENPSAALVGAFAHSDEALARAEEEWTFARNHGIEVLTPSHPHYPVRLSQCDDAPLVLFYKGTASLNVPHVVSVVGTRRCTDYGRQLCQRLTEHLGTLLPDVLIVSGLAYGIDIHAHKGALNAGLKTVGVLAHGLDRIYPPSHRDTAVRMASQGGLLTEFLSGTHTDKWNFVRRNRIVAGLADACIVVESAAKGGGLITASLAQDYNRDVFAFPGRVNDVCSEGCNRLIASNGAQLLTGAEQLLADMRWTPASATASVPKEGNLFAEISVEERLVADSLRGSDGKQINVLVMDTGLPIQRLSTLLLRLEMKGVVRVLPGSVYALS